MRARRKAVLRVLLEHCGAAFPPPNLTGSPRQGVGMWTYVGGGGAATGWSYTTGYRLQSGRLSGEQTYDDSSKRYRREPEEGTRITAGELFEVADDGRAEEAAGGPD